MKKMVKDLGIVTMMIAWGLLVFTICMNTPNEIIYFKEGNTWYKQHNRNTFYYDDMKGKWVRYDN